MTITLDVRHVLRDPARFASRWRLAVEGILLLADDEFRILQADDGEPVEDVFLRIDDDVAAAFVREALPHPPLGGWWYFGRGLIEAWTRHDPDGWLLHEVVQLWLYESSVEQPLYLKIRSHPWGWDQIL